MDLILVKIFATALALSEVMTQSQAVKTHFDPVADQDKVVQTLRAGSAHMRRAFDIDLINLDDLIATALNDQKAVRRRHQGLSRHQFRRPERGLSPVLQGRECRRFGD